MPDERISSIRISADNATALDNLGLLRDFAGTWHGEGFNLIARPDFEGNANLYLQLNQTHETLKIDPIGSSIPNRGFGQNDIELFGLTYLQKISDLATGGALHIEPGIWIVAAGDVSAGDAADGVASHREDGNDSAWELVAGAGHCHGFQRGPNANDTHGAVCLLAISFVQQHAVRDAADGAAGDECGRIVGEADGGATAGVHAIRSERGGIGDESQNPVWDYRTASAHEH